MSTKSGQKAAARVVPSKPVRPRRTTSKRGEAPARSNARRELVETEIYEQASRLFAERGFAGTSLQDIAEVVGITRPALYHYVKSKEELLEKLVTEVTQGAAAEFHEITQRADLDAQGKLRALAKAMVTRLANQPARFRLLDRSEAELPAQLARVHDRAKRSVLNDLVRVVDEGVRSGQFRPVNPRVAALGILGLCNWVAWWFHPDGRTPVHSVAEQLADMAVAAITRASHRMPGATGPAAALALLREDLDYLERTLDAPTTA